MAAIEIGYLCHMANTIKEVAPIVLFGYNRPKHISLTLEALQKNILADESELFIFIDGNKDSRDKILRDEVVDVCRNFDWKGKKKEIILREKNFGLADNIVNGVEVVIQSYKKVIVLEDDIVTAPGFLKYMNDALNFYQHESKVMHVSGYMFPVKNNKKRPTLFYQSTSCWGWATWDDRWRHLERNPTYLMKQLTEQNKKSWFDLDDSGVFLNQLERNVSGQLKSWAILWQASVNLRNGLSLHPYKSLVRNIGLDGTGVNCGTNELYLKQTIVDSIAVEKIPLEFDMEFRQRMIEYYRPKKSTVLNRAKEKIKLILRDMS